MLVDALRRSLVVTLLYGGLVCWLTWPLAGHVRSRLPATVPGSEFDPLYCGWVLAWESHTLARGSLDIANANIYHPAPKALFYGPAALGALPVFAPVYLLTGNPTLALNVLLLGSMALTASMLHLVVRAVTRSHAAGLVAAVTFLANRWLLVTFVPTVPHLAVLFYLPLIAFVVARGRLDTRSALLLLALVILQCAVDPVYVAPAVLLPVAAVSTVWLARRSTRARGLRLLAVTSAASLVPLAVLAGHLVISARNPGLAGQTNWTLHTGDVPVALPWGLFGFMSPLAVASLAPTLVLLAGILALVRGWRGSPGEASAWRHGLLWTSVGIAISLPPRLIWPGGFETRGPLGIAQALLPAVQVLRSPERLRVAALMGMALLAGLAFAELGRHARLAGGSLGKRLAGGAAAAAICAAMYLQYAYALVQPAPYGPVLPTAYRLAPAPAASSPALQALRDLGGPTVEVPLPHVPRQVTMPVLHATAMYRSIFHWQPLLNGYSSFWPATFPALMELAARLPDPSAVRELRERAGLAFVLVRLRSQFPVDAGLARDREAWLALARSGGRDDLELVAADDDVLLFRVGAEAAAGAAPRDGA